MLSSARSCWASRRRSCRRTFLKLSSSRGREIEEVAPIFASVGHAKRESVIRAWAQAGGDYKVAAQILGLHPNSLLRLIRTLSLRDQSASILTGMGLSDPPVWISSKVVFIVVAFLNP